MDKMSYFLRQGRKCISEYTPSVLMYYFITMESDSVFYEDFIAILLPFNLDLLSELWNEGIRDQYIDYSDLPTFQNNYCSIFCLKIGFGP